MNLTPLGFNKIIQGDTLKVLQNLPDECVDCIVTSPPYYALRDYGVNGQIGLEKSFDEYLEKMLAITAELKRVLKSTGTLWWNHGDSYSTASGRMGKDELYGKQPKLSAAASASMPQKSKQNFPDKCLLLQAYRLAMRMIDEQGWILRNIIIWHKPNCMPSSVKDRFTMDYEPILFFTKSKKYWFEMQYEPYESPLNRWGGDKFNYRVRDAVRKASQPQFKATNEELAKYAKSQESFRRDRDMRPNKSGRNKRSVWKIPTRPFKAAHFATFPEALIETPIKAGCPEMICRNCKAVSQKVYKLGEIVSTGGGYDRKGSIKKRTGISKKMIQREHIEIGYTDCGCSAGWEPGIVLDPFMGAGTTAVVAETLKRRWLGIELNPEYIKIAERRIHVARYPILKPVKPKRKKFSLNELDGEAV